MRLRTIVAVGAAVLVMSAVLPVRATTRNVNVRNLSFDPAALETSPGDEIVWSWTQGTHTVTAWSGATFDSEIRSAGQFTTTFSGGIVKYRCELHSDLVNNGTECTGMCGIIGEDIGAPDPPVITHPAPGATVGASVRFTGTSSGADLITLQEGGRAIGQTRTQDDGSWALTMSLTSGSHTINAIATNTIGVQSAAAAVTFDVDALAPAVAISAPADITLQTGEVVIEGIASDAGGIATVAVTLVPVGAGQPITVAAICTGCSDDQATFRGTVDPPPGVWEIAAVATDTVGNQGSAAPVRFLAI